MKKLLLTLLLLFTLGLAAQAQTTESLTLTQETFEATGYKATESAELKDGFKYAALAYKSNGYQFNSGKRCFFMVSQNTNGYTISKVSVKFYNSKNTAKIKVYKSETAYTSQDETAVSASTLVAEQAADKKTHTFTIDEPYFGIVYSGSGALQMSSIVVEYVKGTDTRETAVLAWEPAELNLNLGDEFTAPTLSVKVNDVESADAKSAVAYTSSNPSLLSVAEDGTMTLKEGVTGTAEVTASIPSTNTSFKAEDAIFKVKVVDPNFTGYTALTDISELGGGAQGYILSKEKEAIMGAISGKYYDKIACAANCFTDGALTSVPENANKVTFVSDGTGKYYIKLANGKYMKSMEAKTVSEVETTADATATSISVSEGNISIDFGDAGTLQFNANDPRFTTYTSKQTAVQAYIVTDASLADKPSINIQHGTAAGKLIVNYSFTVKNHNGEEVKVNASVKGMDGVKFSEEQKTNAPALAPGESSVISGTLKATHESLKGNVAPTVVLTATANGKELFAASQAPNKTTGIEDVTVEGEAEAEYFNLQGLRVAQPEAGQLYIKRQGGKAVKVRF